MQRRTFIGGSAAILASPLCVFDAAAEQPKPMPVIGFLSSTWLGPVAPHVAGFRQGLSETGYDEGQNVAIEYRWAEGHYDRLPALAIDLASRKVDVIVTSGTPGIQAAKSATSSIPIIFFGGGDLVAAGLIASLARPGGNLTGIMGSASGLAGFTSKAISPAWGTSSESRSSRLDCSSLVKVVKPVRFPLGRERLATNPLPTGSVE